MAGEDDYFGYSTAQNEQLQQNRQMARRMGEDIRYYPAPPSGDYIEPTTNWDTEEGRVLSSDEEKQAFYQDSIEKINKRIMAQDAAVVRQLADQWYQVNQVLDDLRDRVHGAALKLKDGSDGDGGWSGQGADAFLARGPGATLLSIDAWEDAAVTNWLGTLRLAGVIESRQSEMAALWDRYTQGMVEASTQYLQSKGYESIDDLVPGTPGADQYVTFMRNNQLSWNWEAQKVQYGMARDYWSVMNEDYAGGRATVYEGPTDAVRENPEFIARHKLGEMGLPNITPPRLGPNLTGPNITAPTVGPTITPPNVAAAQLTGPNITAPNVVPDVTTDGGGANLTGPNITAPNVTGPAVVAPVVPPVVPRTTLPGGQPPPAPPALRTGGPPALPGRGLLSNLPGGGVSGVLRSGGPPPSAEGLPPSLPQSRAGQPPPPPQIRGRGSADGTPPAAPQGNRRGPDVQTPNLPPARGTDSPFSQPPAAPSSPVLRNPRVPPPSTARSGGPRRGDPTTSTGLPRHPGTPGPRPDAAPPVLGRPRPKDNRAMPPIRPAVPPGGPDAPANPLAPPPPRTTPIVGRPTRPAAGQRSAEPTTGVLRGLRRAGPTAQAGEITSRKVAPEQPTVNTRDEDFEKIRTILDKEGAWTVETPGGGVLDGARPTAASAEPKPTLGA
nr:hypothetical protein [Micromonospora sp. DSM 115978]